MINKYIKNSNSTNYFKNFEDKVINIDSQKINYNRIAFINKAVAKFNDCKYLEIGCETNICFNSIIANNKKGVDPNSGGTIKSKSDDVESTLYISPYVYTRENMDTDEIVDSVLSDIVNDVSEN